MTRRTSWQEGGDDWLGKYVRLACETTPSAQELHEPVGLGVLSAVVGNSFYVQINPTKEIYPNIWAILVGPSSVAYKSTALEFGEEIARRVKDNSIPNDFTSSALKKALNDGDGVGIIWDDEIGEFLRKAKHQEYMQGCKEMLTCMFDGKSLGLLRVGSSEKFTELKVKSPCVSWIGCTTPRQLMIDKRDLENGWLARFLMVRGEKGDFKPDFEDDEKEREELDDLISEAKEIHKCLPSKPLEARPDKEAKELANRYRKGWHEKLPDEDEIVAPGISRIVNTYLYKFAMLIEAFNLTEEPEEKLTLTKETMQRAIELCEKFIGSTKSELFRIEGKAEEAKHQIMKEKVERKLREKNGWMKRSKLLQNVRNLNAEDLDTIVDELEEEEAKFERRKIGPGNRGEKYRIKQAED